METIIVEIPLQLIAEVDKYETVLLRCQSPNSHVTSSPVPPSWLDLSCIAPSEFAIHPPAMRCIKELLIPRPQCHNAMFSMGSGGPGRTRTFDQGIHYHTD